MFPLGGSVYDVVNVLQGWVPVFDLPLSLKNYKRGVRSLSITRKPPRACTSFLFVKTGHSFVILALVACCLSQTRFQVRNRAIP